MAALAPCASWIDADDLDCDGTPDNLALAASAASWVLYVLSAMQFPGPCARTSRPGEDLRNCWVPIEVYTNWYDRDWAISAWRAWGHVVNLGWADVVSVESVTINGAVVDPAEYHVEDDCYLWRNDRTPWPPNDSFVVQLTAGVGPPDLGILAAKALACEILKLLPGGDDSACKLSPRMRSFVRSGLSASTVDASKTPSGNVSTGIVLVDLFLSAVNPSGLTALPIIAVPGVGPYTHVRNT